MNAADIRHSLSSFYDDIWNRHDGSALDSLLSPKFTFRGSLGRTCRGHAEFAKYVSIESRNVVPTWNYLATQEESSSWNQIRRS